MNPDKLNKLLQLAKNFTGNDFWSEIFDEQPAQPLIGRTPAAADKHKQTARLFPDADVMTSDNEMLIIIDLPGVQKEDIQLSINDEALYIKGEVKPLFSQYRLVSSERFSGSFERPIALPVKIDGHSAKIKASFINGTLVVRIPISASWQRPIDIQIVDN